MFRQTINKNGFKSRRILAALLASALGLTSSTSAFAVPAPAGTDITNTASVTYFNEDNGTFETVRSNTVVAEVSPVPALELTGGQELRTARSTQGQYNFRATNIGNVDLDVSFDLDEILGDDFDVNGDLFMDTNGNGVVDDGELIVQAGSAYPIRQGESTSLVYKFRTPAKVITNDESVSRLEATATPKVGPTTPVTVAAESKTIIDSDALNLFKAGTLRADDGEIDYTINARNNGEVALDPYSEIEGEALLVDGAPRMSVVVRDLIPLNARLKSGESSGGFDIVYHRRGDAAHSYLSVPITPLSDIDAIAFLHDGAYGVGRSSDLTFTVSVVNTVEATEIRNEAVAYLLEGGRVNSQPSNEVIHRVDGPGHTIDFKRGTTNETITSTGFDTNVSVEIGAASCNATFMIDVVEVTVTTRFSNDREVLTAWETGANTGIFRTAPIGVIRADRGTPLNNVLEGTPGDTTGALATAVCLGETLETSLNVQPGGFVFDSVTNAPVPGSRVVVFPQGVAPSPVALSIPFGASAAPPVGVTESMTDSNGYFDLGAISQGGYHVVVYPPADYQYPSVRTNFAGFQRRVDDQISYGLDFVFAGGPIANIDIPLDPAVAIPLALNKTADREKVRRGGVTIFTLTAKNRMAQALLAARIEDALPPGLIFVDGSARLNGAPFAVAPTMTPDGVVTFDLDRIGPNGEAVVTYAVRIGTAAGQGDKTNTAILRGVQAGTTTAVASQQARATVTVDDRGGVFADEAVVIGRVFLDKNGDGIQTDDEVERGVPGVKIVTSTGLSVVTDSEGRYSLFGLRPVTQTFALQSSTLPVSAKPMLVEVDDALAPGSRLIDLKRGELRGEDFPLVWTPQAEADVVKRAERFEGLDASEAFGRDDLPLNFDSATRNSARGEAGLDTRTELQTVADPKKVAKEAADVRDAKRIDIEDQIKTLDPALGFVGLKDGAEIGRPSLTLRVKSPAEVDLSLRVNGKVVSASQIGAKVIDRDRGVQVFEYVALRLQPNENRIAVSLTDPFGNERSREITVFAPGAPAGLTIVAPEVAPANARARLPITVRVVDAKGRLVRVPAEVTLTAENGQWDVRDIRDQTPGLQAYIDNGEAIFDFIPPDLVGGETIGVEADFAEMKTEIGFTPDLSERTFVGVIEGAIAFGEQGRLIEGFMEKDNLNAFEETTEGVRGQVYLKGKILGENLLTLRYNSDQDTEDRLFRDIRRDEFYPVYGDNSERGFDAQSSTSLYVKVEREQSYLLYGDIAVEAQAEAIRLGAYRRSLTGGRAHVEYGPVTVDLFVAQTSEQQKIIEVRGRGVSGPYDIDLGGLEEGTEVVELIVRDRDQPAVILSSQPQTRLSDYTLDFFRGSLIFNRPVPQLDDDLNPVSIRVTYETGEGVGDEYFVYGGEIRVEPVEGIAIGYREVRSNADRALDDRRTVRAGYAEADFAAYGKAQIEVAQTENNLEESGMGLRASYDYRDDRTTVRFDAARTDEDFDAPNSYVNAGREELRLITDHVITDRINVGTEVLYTRDTVTDDTRTGGELRGRYTASDQLDLIAGVRAVDTDRSGSNSDVLSAIAGVEWRPVQLPGATLRAEYEQDIKDSGNWRVLLGGDYQWSPKLRFYALNEISSTETGFFGIGDGADTNFVTKVGAEFQVTERISGYSEYRDTGGLTGDGGVASGVKTTWDMTEHLAMRAGFEHVEPLANGDDRSSSATLGAVYENEEQGLIWRNDVEVDRDERGLGLYTNTAVGYELDKDFTVLARNRFAYDKRSDDRIRDRLRVGLAYRPEHDSRVKALALYEFEVDDDQTVKEVAHRWSFGGTYSPTDDLRMNARYSGEHVDFDGVGFSDASTLHLLRAGAEFDIYKDRFAVGGHAVLFSDDAGSDVTAGVGIELKANVAKNIQVGVGFNHIDVEEERLRDLYQSGFYARVRLKLDESVWDEFDRVGVTSGFGTGSDR